MFILTLVVVYIVDVSGFTKSWRSVLAHFLKTEEKNLRPLPPFDCSKCATFWVCLAYIIITGHFGLFTFAFCALLSLLSIPVSQAEIFIREWLTQSIAKLLAKI